MKKRIHLLGKGAGWRDIEKVIDDKDGEIWGVNDSFLRTPQVAVTFHMHNLREFADADLTASSMRLTTQRANKNPDMEFYSVSEYEPIPHCKAYPLEEVIDYFKVCYFGSTPDYMIALAIMRGAEELYYYGLNMTVKQEYIEQKPGMEFWTGLAMGRGIKCHLQYDHTSLLKTRDGLLYGYLMDQWRVDDEKVDD
jgi:hypothetical protein